MEVKVQDIECILKIIKTFQESDFPRMKGDEFFAGKRGLPSEEESEEAEAAEDAEEMGMGGDEGTPDMSWKDVGAEIGLTHQGAANLGDKAWDKRFDRLNYISDSNLDTYMDQYVDQSMGNMKEYNKQIFTMYKMNEINQHSVGMIYVNILLCVNDRNEKDEYKNWNKYFPMVINSEKALEQGYFFAVTEAKLKEVSCVIAGSNELTPTIEPLKNIQEVEPNEVVKAIDYDYLINNFKL
jgi:hypothetical protein